MKRPLAALATTVTAALGLTLAATPSASAANSGHNLMLYKSAEARSVYVSTTDLFGAPRTYCPSINS